jgi:REP element-mobilizing transposase RayT
VFETAATVDSVRAQFQQSSALFDFEIPAYCFMPDHMHALLLASSEQADFLELVRRFKQLSGFDYRRTHDQRLWQPGFYERILRDDEATEAVARYILENPIRAGLTQALGEYPFAWSDTDDLASLVELWHPRSELGRT